MKTSPNDASNHEVLEAISSFASSVDERFNRVDKEITEIKRVMVTKDELKHEIGELRLEMHSEIGRLESEMHSEIGKLKTTMVTKGYLDDKLADLHSDFVQYTRREIENTLK